MVFIVLFMLFFSCCTNCFVPVSDQASSIEQLKRLRTEQKTSSYNEYHAHEKRIALLKHEQNTSRADRPIACIPGWLIFLVHLVPFIFWQLCALGAAFALLVLHGRSWFLWLLFCCSLGVVSAGYYERSCPWLTIPSSQVTVRIGPGEQYPKCMRLQYLDEVRVLESRTGWLQIVCDGSVGWICTMDVT